MDAFASLIKKWLSSYETGDIYPNVYGIW